MSQSKLLEIVDEKLINTLYQFCYARTSHSYEAEELCSDILYAVVKAGESERKAERELVNPQAYFWSVARKIYSVFCEKRRRKAMMLFGDDAEELFSLMPDRSDEMREETEADRVLLESVLRQIANLSRAYRQVMIGFYLDGKSTSQLAEELGISETAVRQRLFAARNDIRNEVNKMSANKTLDKPTALQEMNWVIWGTGDPSAGDLRSVFERQLSKHVIWLCRNKPKSAREIADELGLPMAYVEEELELQVRGPWNGCGYGALRKTDSGKYISNFILLDGDEMKSLHKIYIDAIPMICDIVVKHIEDHAAEYLAFPYINKKPDLNLILWQQVKRLASAFGYRVEDCLASKYFGDVKKTERPFFNFGYRDYDGSTRWGGGQDGIAGSDICGCEFVSLYNIYTRRIYAHFHCGHEITNDPELRMAIRAIDGLQVSDLSDWDKEIAAKAIEHGYLFRDEDMLYTKFLVANNEDTGKLFDVSDLIFPSIPEEAVDEIASKTADFINKHLPKHLMGEMELVITLAMLPVLDTLVEALIERGILTPPENGIGAEGIWMAVKRPEV